MKRAAPPRDFWRCQRAFTLSPGKLSRAFTRPRPAWRSQTCKDRLAPSSAITPAAFDQRHPEDVALDRKIRSIRHDC